MLLSIRTQDDNRQKKENFILKSRSIVKTSKLSSSLLSSIPLSPLPKIDIILPVLVFACNRPRALQQHVEALISIRKNQELNPIIISLDCDDRDTVSVAQQFGTKIKKIIKQPDLSEIIIAEKDRHMLGYYKIARHYLYTLNYVFNELNYDGVIITEDDLEVSPDFLDYFMALYPLLVYDKTLWCVSAWNDNGLVNKIIREPTLLHRTDFFPGLGWMLTKSLWNEIKGGWPKSYWDDWMRLPAQRKNRSCIRPEISRTAISFHGQKGVSNGQHFDRYLKKIVKNMDMVNWKKIDISYLLKDRYDVSFRERVNSCKIITVSDLNHLSTILCARLIYNSNQEFVAIANTLEIMNDLKVSENI
ncbi:unnamed protein product [Didymodactylos carnosus]|uniref:Alpha-1,3-mannosyl-glycoprotein 2-beta-N-acetylglucosaminyltransferase n=1 Tax=Didymodactylos carnosus TaxID=1234261 RepID=A0A813Q5Z0_9BILA|nr:unnamed protein product [Didymodactylos carnosus]CAF0830237.1 unnamed protein product [Didymodactylos carnosus]CAF3543481.1 unnamed protein product [Didymodactylos carnosus]CAF3614720.1 unnamed protein product [Didymodactylos carnosus]